ncbi:phytoene desaturase family protein [Spongisporangium articulatum]|uniref:Phytoene desaturase family protein n=1 Tax=Spongisporangium articulatum TaxID=3362603 RepID=A0ABW8AST9_9ACTN
MARVAVVGAGLGGLAAAARLGTLGHSVTVFEQAETIGGKLGFVSRDGFGFDTGPSLLTLPATYRDLFLKTGRPLEKVLDLQPVDPACHYRFGSSSGAALELDLPNVSTSRIAAAWDDALGPGAGADWNAFLQRAARIWDLTREPFLESPLQGLGTLLRLARPGDVRTVAPFTSLRQLGAKYLKHPAQRQFLDRYATYTGSDPRRAPAALATVPFVEQRFGAWYVPGGLRRLGEAVHARALERKVEVRTSARVTRVSTAGGRVDGVFVGDEFVPADVVVANADAAQVYDDLLAGDRSARAARRRAGRATPSLSGFVLLLALRGRTPGLRHHTVLFGDDYPTAYDAEFDAVFGTGPFAGAPRPVPDPTVYVSAPDDPALRPDDDHEALFVLVNAPRHSPDGGPAGVDWRAPGLAERYADDVLAVMARRGLDVRGRVLWREIRTPADLEAATLSRGGSIYGTSSNGPRAAFLRPANRGPVDGLFLVGGSAHPGGGLPLVALSAAIVADLVGPA